MKSVVIGFFPACSYRRWNGENVHLSVYMPPILPCVEKLGSWGKSEIRSPGLTFTPAARYWHAGKDHTEARRRPGMTKADGLIQTRTYRQ